MNEQRVIRVLVAEDDPIQRALMYDALSAEEDIECCGLVSDGLQALKMLRETLPDVLLLDVVMPNMDGVDLLRILQEEPLEVTPKIIVISAYEHESITKEVLSQGADCFLLKPYRIDLLINRIRLLMEKGAKQHEEPLPECIFRVLMDLGVQTNSIGFRYLHRALEILVKNPNVCVMSKDVYGVIAAENNTTNQCVEKALRSAISQIFEESPAELHRMLKFALQEHAEHMTNSQFLTLTAMYIRLNKLM